MSRAYGIGARHFFVRQSEFRDGYVLLEQGKGNNFSLFSKSRTKLYQARKILNEIWQESKKG